MPALGQFRPIYDGRAMSASPPIADISMRRTKRREGPWLCKNSLAEALTAVDLGEVDALSHFREFGEFLVSSCA